MAELAPNEEIVRLRKPQQIFTDAYLNDPIQFAPTEPFNVESAVEQLQTVPVVRRDFAQFLQVELNATGSQLYPVQMYINRLERSDYERNIDRTFRRLI